MDNDKKINQKTQKFKQSYYNYYDDVKDHTKGFKEDW